MGTEQTGTILNSDPLPSHQEAAAYVGFTLQTFAMWVRRGLLPRPVEDQSGWTREVLTEALDRVSRLGLQNDNPNRRHSHFIKIYNCQRIWRKLEQGEGAGHWLFYFRPTGETLPAPWGCAEFMSALIAAERLYASQHPEAPPLQPRTPQAGPRPAPPTAKEIIERTRVPSPPIAPTEWLGKLSPQLRPTQIAARFGFTPRYWTKPRGRR